ncbi:MAG: glycosyl hydrolase [Monoraphidium minutum]|nr:MAG: glycosyl hydrolase [Monoraphidium minutum]
MHWLKLLALLASIGAQSCATGALQSSQRQQWSGGGARALRAQRHRASPFARIAAPPLRDDPDAAKFVSGTVPLDTDGNPVYAHEGHIITQDDGLFLWYGTSQKQPLGGSEWASDSIRLYTSRDLASWRSRGRVFTNASIPALGAPPPYSIGPVKALYNPARRQYVLLFGVSSPGGGYSTLGFASAVSPLGPFKWELAAAADGWPYGDAAAAADAGGGGAYLARSLGANGTVLSRLKDDYLGTTGACSSVPAAGAPALFQSGGRWYLLSARHTGFEPAAPPQLFVSGGPDPCGGGWSKLPPLGGRRGAGAGFGGRPAFVFTQRWGDGGELQIYAGDRWNARGAGGVANASYVFLPLLPAGGDPPAFTLPRLERWRVGDFRPAAPS